MLSRDKKVLHMPRKDEQGSAHAQ